MAEGLFYVYTDPGSVDEAEFHDWYDHEHGPARLTVPGFLSASRYHALDGLEPPWLAMYELASPEVIDSPEYKALGATASARDEAIGAGLASLERRVYEQISTDGSPVGRTAPVILAVSMSVPEEAEADLDAWYTDEHIPMLLSVPGWQRIRRYRLVNAMDAAGPDLLSLHEVAGPEVFENADYLAAISTPWRDRIVSSALRRDRRLFGLRNVLEA